MNSRSSNICTFILVILEKLIYLIFNAVNIFASKVVGFIKLVKNSQNQQHVKSNYYTVLIDYFTRHAMTVPTSTRNRRYHVSNLYANIYIFSVFVIIGIDFVMYSLRNSNDVLLGRKLSGVCIINRNENQINMSIF